MKVLKSLVFAVFAFLLIVSCSSDDDNVVADSEGNMQEEQVVDETFIFPATNNSFWNYNVTNRDNINSEEIQSQDNLIVEAQTATTIILDVNNGEPANGPYIGILTSGTLTKTDATLVVDGFLELPGRIGELLDLNIAIEDFMLYDKNANVGAILGATNDTVSQDLNGLPLTINYELISKAVAFSETLEINGETYADVITTDLTLELSTSTIIDIGVPLPVSILDTQNILVSTNYYVDGIGLVLAETNTDYQISDELINFIAQSGSELGFPETGSNSINQLLTDYSIN